MKLLLENRKENITGFVQGRPDYWQFLETSLNWHKTKLEKLAIFFSSYNPFPS